MKMKLYFKAWQGREGMGEGILMLRYTMKGTGEVLREEKSQCRSGRDSRTFIMSLPLKPSRVSQGLKEKPKLLTLPFVALQRRPYILSRILSYHMSTSEVLIWQLKGRIWSANG